MLVNPPTSRPFTCLPLFGLPSTLHCDRTTMHNHTRLPTSLPFTRMQQCYNALHESPTGLPLHQYITIHHLVVTEPITFHSPNTSDPTYLNIPRYRSTPLLTHSTPYLSLYYSFPLSPALDSVNMYFPSFTFIYDTLGKHVSTRWPITPARTPLGNIQVFGLVRSSYWSWDGPSSPWFMESSSEDMRSSRSPSIPTASADAIAAVASCRRAITSVNCMVPSTIHLVLRPTPIKHGASNDAASIDGRIPLVLTANSLVPIHGIWT